jgi:hypothetical protein
MFIAPTWSENRADRHRRPVAAAGRRRDAGQPLDQHVLAGAAEVWPALAVARARAVDDARVDRLEVLVAVAHPGEDAGAEVLDDVGLGPDPVEDPSPLHLQIDRERALVAVPGEKVRSPSADPAVVEGHSAKQVTLPRPLDLDDVGAHVGEELGGERPLQEVAEIEHGDVGQGFFGHGFCTRCSFVVAAAVLAHHSRRASATRCQSGVPVGRCRSVMCQRPRLAVSAAPSKAMLVGWEEVPSARYRPTVLPSGEILSTREGS